MRCPNCGARVKKNDEYCPVCDTRLHKKSGRNICDTDVCPVCGEELHDGTEFCNNCGAHIVRENAEHTGETAAEAYSCKGDHDWSNISPEVSDEHAGETFVEAYSCDDHDKPKYKEGSAEAYYHDNIGSDDIRQQYLPPKFGVGDILTLVFLLFSNCGFFVILQIMVYSIMKSVYQTGKPSDYIRLKKLYGTVKTILVFISLLSVTVTIISWLLD